MAGVVQAVDAVERLIGRQPVVVGGLAVMCRLSTPHRATVDLDVVERLQWDRVPQLELLRAATGAEAVEPAAVLLPTGYGAVKVDVLQVRQAEIDVPSDDPGDRLHAAAHAWANESATEMVIEVIGSSGAHVQVRTLVAEPGSLVAMKLQAVMNRSVDKQGTDLLDIVRLTFDEATRDVTLDQLGGCDLSMAADIALHIDLWFVRRRDQALRSIHDAGGATVTPDDLDLAAELLLAACSRP